jgi:hypothetical protein
MYAAFPYISARDCFHDLTHDIIVTRQQLYHCTNAPLQVIHKQFRENTEAEIRSKGISTCGSGSTTKKSSKK